jgi:hypothetical protein
MFGDIPDLGVFWGNSDTGSRSSYADKPSGALSSALSVGFILGAISPDHIDFVTDGLEQRASHGGEATPVLGLHAESPAPDPGCSLYELAGLAENVNQASLVPAPLLEFLFSLPSVDMAAVQVFPDIASADFGKQLVFRPLACINRAQFVQGQHVEGLVDSLIREGEILALLDPLANVLGVGDIRPGEVGHVEPATGQVQTTKPTATLEQTLLDLVPIPGPGITRSSSPRPTGSHSVTVNPGGPLQLALPVVDVGGIGHFLASERRSTLPDGHALCGETLLGLREGLPVRLELHVQSAKLRVLLAGQLICGLKTEPVNQFFPYALSSINSVQTLALQWAFLNGRGQLPAQVSKSRTKNRLKQLGTRPTSGHAQQSKPSRLFGQGLCAGHHRGHSLRRQQPVGRTNLTCSRFLQDPTEGTGKIPTTPKDSREFKRGAFSALIFLAGSRYATRNTGRPVIEGPSRLNIRLRKLMGLCGQFRSLGLGLTTTGSDDASLMLGFQGKPSLDCSLTHPEFAPRWIGQNTSPNIGNHLAQDALRNLHAHVAGNATGQDTDTALGPTFQLGNALGFSTCSTGRGQLAQASGQHRVAWREFTLGCVLGAKE